MASEVSLCRLLGLLYLLWLLDAWEGSGFSVEEALCGFGLVLMELVV